MSQLLLLKHQNWFLSLGSLTLIRYQNIGLILFIFWNHVLPSTAQTSKPCALLVFISHYIIDSHSKDIEIGVTIVMTWHGFPLPNTVGMAQLFNYFDVCHEQLYLLVILVNGQNVIELFPGLFWV